MGLFSGKLYRLWGKCFRNSLRVCLTNDLAEFTHLCFGYFCLLRLFSNKF